MKIERHYYNPTNEQREALKRAAAELRGRTRAMRALRDTISGFNMCGLAAQRAADSARQFIGAYRANGWSETAAGELAAYHHINGAAAL